MAGKAADKAGIPRFTNALMVFIKQEQIKVKVVKNTLNNRCKNDDLGWANKYLVWIYDFIAMWKIKSVNEREIQYNCKVVQFAFK